MESPRKFYQLHHFSHFTWKSLSKRSQADFKSQRWGRGRSKAKGLSRRDKFVQSRSNWSAIRSSVAYLIALTRHETKRIQCCRDIQLILITGLSVHHATYLEISPRLFCRVREEVEEEKSKQKRGSRAPAIRQRCYVQILRKCLLSNI